MKTEQYCLSTAASNSIEDVAAANEAGAAAKNESNSVHQYSGPNGGNATSPRFFQLYMGHDDEIVSVLNGRVIERETDQPSAVYRRSRCLSAPGILGLTSSC